MNTSHQQDQKSALAKCRLFRVFPFLFGTKQVESHWFIEKTFIGRRKKRENASYHSIDPYSKVSSLDFVRESQVAISSPLWKPCFMQLPFLLYAACCVRGISRGLLKHFNVVCLTAGASAHRGHTYANRAG